MSFDNPLFISLPTIIGSVVALLIMFVALSYVLYFPTVEKLENRRKSLQENIDNAQKLNTDAQVNFNDSIKRVNESKIEARQNVDSSVEQASFVKKDIINEAKNEKKIIIDDAKLRVEKEVRKIKEDSKDEIAAIAMMAASKIIEKEVDNVTNKKLVDELIKKVIK